MRVAFCLGLVFLIVGLAHDYPWAWGAVAAAGVLVALGLLSIAWFWLALLVRGWGISRAGRDSLRYTELASRRIRRLQIDGEMLTGKLPFAVYVPSKEEWDARYPEWAHGRRDEIMLRVSSALPRYEYRYRG